MLAQINRVPCYLLAYLVVTSLAWVTNIECNMISWSIAVAITLFFGEIIYNWVKNLEQ